AAIAVAERPNARRTRREAVVDLNVAARICRDTGLAETKVVGVRATPDSDKHVRADDFGIAGGALDPDGDPHLMPGKADAFGAGADGYPLAFQDLADRLRHV